MDFADALHAKLPVTEIIPEKMQSGQIRSSLQNILEVIRQSFIFLNEYVKTSASRMPYAFDILSRLTLFSEQLLSSQKDKISDLKNKLSEASTNYMLNLLSTQYVETSEYRVAT